MLCILDFILLAKGSHQRVKSNLSIAVANPMENVQRLLFIHISLFPGVSLFILTRIRLGFYYPLIVFQYPFTSKSVSTLNIHINLDAKELSHYLS